MSGGSDRLERSRLAILEHLHRRDQRRHGRDPDQQPALAADEVHDAGLPPHGLHAHPDHPAAGASPDGWFATARDQFDAWWRYHPAHMAVDMARPALSAYARRKPVQYLGIAAASGAVLFLLRPWKLVSVTGVLVALVKSPQVAGMVMSALSRSHNPRGDEAAGH